MAYDPNDPKDKATVQALIDTALEEAREVHEAEVEGLKTKNTELLGKIRKARTAGGDDSAAEVERLETELTTVQGELRGAQSKLRQAERDLTARTAERDTAVTSLATETKFSADQVINGGLTTALIAANVQPQFLEDLTASLSSKATVKEVDGKRQAFVGDKPLGEFITEWSQGDKGKHYVGAPANGGGGTTPPGNPQGGAKKIYEMNTVERNAAYTADPAGFQARVDAGENKPPLTTPAK